MKMMTCKQYEQTLDIQFTINNRTFTVARFPSGWCLYEEGAEQPYGLTYESQKSAIKVAEIVAGGKVNPKEIKYL